MKYRWLSPLSLLPPSLPLLSKKLLPSGLLPILLGAGILIFPSSAEAGQLQSWQFSSRDNRLTFTTDEGVLPSVQLVPDPMRLVIDLPGTSLGRSRVSQSAEDGIHEIRLAQFNANTTRIVIELSPGYTIDPAQVKVQGTSDTNWTVQLPTPQQSEVAQNPDRVTLGSVTLGSVSEGSVSTGTVSAGTILEGVRVTQDGFFFRTSGRKPELVQEYSDDRRQLTLELKDTVLSSRLTQRDITLDRYRVSRIQLVPVEGTPVVRIVLDVAGGSPDWQATVANLGGIVLVPVGGLAAADPGDRTSQSLTSQSLTSESLTRGSSRHITTRNQPSPTRTAIALANPELNTPIELPDVSNQRVRIAIDPGHGGHDPGAVGIDGLQEKIIVLDIAQKVTQLLEQQGAQVILTRSDDTEIELEPRVQDANQGNANVFVSIHANAIDLDHPGTNGAETYYYSSDEAFELAQAIQTSVAQGTGMRNIGVKQARFYVLRNTHMPAALVEVGFVTGQVDAPRLADPTFRDRMAQAITRGILQYVQQRL